MKAYLEMGIEHPGIILEAEGDTEADMLYSIWIRGCSLAGYNREPRKLTIIPSQPTGESDESIMYEIGITESTRDRFLLTEVEQDNAIKEMLAEISGHGKYKLSSTTKRFASCDALCAAQFCKVYRLLMSK